jgi:subtilisin
LGTGDTPGTPGYSGLLHKAEQRGSVRAIVGLRTGFEPEGGLSRSEVARQRDDIAHARSGLQGDLRGTGYRTVRRFETLPYVALELSPGALKAAERSPNVTSIVEDVAVSPTLAESTPIIQAPQMWSSGYTGAGKTVAVLDTGVDSSHPFLSGKVVEEACYSSGADCPNGGTSQTGAGSASPCDYSSRCDHGTHVAGIVAGEGTDFSGVAPGADIMAVQVFSEFTGADCNSSGVSPCPKTNQSDYIAGLQRVYQLRNAHEFSSVNMSFGGGMYTSDCDTALQGVKAAIDNLKSVGVATVISAGNNGYTDALGAPACISSAVSVGGTTDADQVASSSDWGTGFGSNSASFLDLFAPGTAINSSVPGGGFAGKNGTSMAAPHVAGAWALLEQHSPTSSTQEILSALQGTGTMVHDERAAGGATRPRINVADAAEVLNPIANDQLANAQSIEGRSASLNDTNVGATREASEPDHLPQLSTSVGTHSVWYRWKAPVSGRVEINTCFSDFDTVLAAYSGGSTFDSLSPVASDNDSCSGSIVSNDSGSKVSFDVTQGATYRIAVAGYSNNSEGPFTLYARYLPPANNDLANALTVNGSVFSQKGSTVAATRQGGEPDHLPENANTLGEHSVWYAWTAPSSGKVTLDTCASSFDTVLAVYSGGSAFDNLSPVASNDDGDTCPGSIPFNHLGSQVSFNAVQGRTYRIAVTGFWQTSDGSFFLHMNDETPPRVKSTSPANKATGVSPSANARANFTEAMEAGTINTATFKLKRKGATNSVAATVTYNAQDRRAVLNPDANLKAGATYTATVTTGAEDLAGNHLDQTDTSGDQKKSWTFKVKS